MKPERWKELRRLVDPLTTDSGMVASLRVALLEALTEVEACRRVNGLLVEAMRGLVERAAAERGDERGEEPAR